MIQRHLLLYAIIITFGIHSLSAMVYDNRFFPLYARTYSRTLEKKSAGMPDLFLMLANHAYESGDKDVGIPELFGAFNEARLGQALTLVGLPNPLPTEFLNETDLPWKMHGKIEGQGVSFQHNQHLWNRFSAGFSVFFMHVFSRNTFSLDPTVVTKLGLDADAVEALDQARRTMNDELGIQAPQWSKAGFSDVDAYIRYGNVWEYFLKCRRIDVGIRAGGLFPTGVVRDINNPASVPFGGDGHWGFYVSGDGEFELKEDWKVGILLRINKRFKKNKMERLPVAQEQELYGAVSGEASIDPGVTVIFSPYAQLESIRDGFGLQAKYTLVVHEEDTWSDQRIVKTPALNTLNIFQQNSAWSSEYITVNAFYDFAHIAVRHKYALKVSLMWDVPVRLFKVERVSKTNRVSLGVEFNF